MPCDVAVVAVDSTARLPRWLLSCLSVVWVMEKPKSQKKINRPPSGYLISCTSEPPLSKDPLTDDDSTRKRGCLTSLYCRPLLPSLFFFTPRCESPTFSVSFLLFFSDASSAYKATTLSLTHSHFHLHSLIQWSRLLRVNNPATLHAHNSTP